MNSQVAGIVFVFSLVLSVDWTFSNKIVLAQSTTEGRTEERTEGSREVHVIIKANGEVLLQRDEDTEFHPASVNTELFHGDVLQLEEDAVVVVLCANKSQWNVPPGTESGVSSGCGKKSPPPPPPLPNKDPRVPARGGDEETPSNTFQILSPRNGINLTDDKITIRWKRISEANRYTVQIVQIVDLEDKVIWEKELEIGDGKEEAEVVFQPADDRPLQDNIAYIVKIKAHRENLPAIEVEEIFHLLNEQ